MTEGGWKEGKRLKKGVVVSEKVGVVGSGRVKVKS